MPIIGSFGAISRGGFGRGAGIQPFGEVDYLLIAGGGGGGGGSARGGGGGAGGLLYIFFVHPRLQ